MIKLLLLVGTLAVTQVNRELSEFNEKRLDAFERDMRALQTRHLDNDPVMEGRVSTVEDRSEDNRYRLGRLEMVLLGGGTVGGIGGVEIYRRKRKKRNGGNPEPPADSA